MALVDNKTKIQALIDGINALPTAGSGENIMLQEKTATPTEETQSITPDTGYNGLSKVEIEPIPAEYIIPTGELSITENGTHDVTSYASVNVAVESGGSVEEVTTCNVRIVTTGSPNVAHVAMYGQQGNGDIIIDKADGLTWGAIDKTFNNIKSGTLFMVHLVEMDSVTHGTMVTGYTIDGNATKAAEMYNYSDTDNIYYINGKQDETITITYTVEEWSDGL